MQALVSQGIVRFGINRLQYLRLRLKPSGIISNSSTRLLLINTGTCCVLYSMGDICRQKFEGHNNDWARTGRMAILGTCLAPLDHFWYTALERILPAVTARTVVKKVLLDQIVMAPICCSVFFIGKLHAILQNHCTLAVFNSYFNTHTHSQKCIQCFYYNYDRHVCYGRTQQEGMCG